MWSSSRSAAPSATMRTPSTSKPAASWPLRKARAAVCFVASDLRPGAAGPWASRRSKAAQLGIKRLMEMGIMPDIIACRATNPVSEKVRQKISMYTNVPHAARLLDARCRVSIYMIPESLREAGIDREVLTLLAARPRGPAPRGRGAGPAGAGSRTASARRSDRSRSASPASTRRSATPTPRSSRPEHAGCTWACDVQVQVDRTTTDHRRTNVGRALWPTATASSCPAASAFAAPRARSSASATPARTNMPYLGLCLGFQMAVDRVRPQRLRPARCQLAPSSTPGLPTR